LPVLLDPYGGPSRQRVTDEGDWRDLVSQWFAEHGFAVLTIDGAGTPGRGPDWEREIHGDQFGPVLDDQIAGLHAAAHEHPDLDLSRVGIRGWSFGGTIAELAVLRRPDVFHAAVAGAAPNDSRLYNAQWRERYLGQPDEHPERYDANCLIGDAPNLARPLLLMHGLSDDNVHPAHTLRMSAALLAAGKPHEVVLLPGVGHSAIGSAATEGILRTQLDFLRKHLGHPSVRNPSTS
jgi:dipeptidyl-peptidase-4